jgi:hypothetical protein
MMKALRRNAGSKRAFSNGYKKGCAMKKTMPYYLMLGFRVKQMCDFTICTCGR